MAVIFFVATILAYRPGLHGPFLLDDHVSLVLLAEDERSIGQWIERLRNAPSNVRKRVLSNFSFMANQAVAGAWSTHAPYPFKLGNLLIHLLCASAVFALARRLVLLVGDDARRAAWIGLFAAALFALHPLQVSTTLYVVQRMAQLSALFSLLAVLAYIRWRMEIARAGDVRNVLNLALVPLFALLAFLSKENGALVPLYLLVIELCFFRLPPGVFRPAMADSANTTLDAQGVSAADLKSRFEMGFGLFAAGPVLAAAVALPFLWSRFDAGYALRDFSMLERLLTQIHALWHYLGLIVWPRVGSMGLYRDDFPLTTALDVSTFLLGAMLLVLLVAALILRRRAPMLAFAVLWFGACHAMESSFLALELVFEHRNYLALVGPAVALAYHVARWNRPAGLAPSAAAALLAVLAMQTYSRASAWSSQESWLTQEATHRTDSLRAGTDLMLFLANRGRHDEALDVLQRLERHHPASGHPLLAAMALRCWNLDASPPSAAQLDALRSLSLSKDSYHLFGMVMERKGNDRCDGLGWDDLALVAEAAADNPHVRRHSVSEVAWRRFHSRALMRVEDWARAQRSLESVLALRDDDPRDWLALARVRLVRGDVQGFREARSGLLALWPRPDGAVAQELAQLDALLARALIEAGSR